MPAPTNKITSADARNALLRSGYLLESRVANKLRSLGYYVQANDIYPDPETGKAREYDLSAIHAVKAGPNDFDYLFLVPLIECVNNPQPIAFITTEPQVGFLHYQEIKMSGLPVKINISDGWLGLSDFLEMNKYHHYCSGRIATQYCSFQKKKGSQNEWMAFHDDTHFGALKTLCDVVENEIEKHYDGWSFEAGKQEDLNVQIYYPILVTQGDLLEVDVRPRSIRVTKANHIQYRRSILKHGVQIAYQIDVVTERYLPRLIKLGETEIEKTARLLRRRHKKIREAIDLIANAASEAKGHQELQELMSF
jgi:hypothetical protein